VILGDVERDTLSIDLNKIKLKKNAKALIHVSINGRSGDMDEVVNFCKNNNLYLIEDSCQAFGSKRNNRFLGTFGDIGVFSYTPHKIITTGQGGAVVTDNEEIYDKVKKLKDFYRVKPGVDIHTGLGFNFKFTDLQAVIGLEQLKIIDYRMKKKKEIYQTYMDKLSGVEFIEFLPIDLEQTLPWFVDIILKNVSRENFISYLKKNGIGSREFYPPIHSQNPYSKAKGDFDVVSEIAPRGVWLPSSIKLGLDEIGNITKTIRKFE
jgi:perosamine synthetase